MPFFTDEQLEKMLERLRDPGHMDYAPDIADAIDHLHGYKHAIVEAAVVDWCYTLEHEQNPQKALADLLGSAIKQTLDPVISIDAQILMAETLARAAHALQYTKYDVQPYIEHVERVAAQLEGLAKVVGWLHDVVEDTSITLAGIHAARFDIAVVVALDLVTRKVTRGETYGDYIDRIAVSGNQLAIRTKIADLQDNLRPSCPPTLRSRYEPALAKLLPLRTE